MEIVNGIFTAFAVFGLGLILNSVIKWVDAKAFHERALGVHRYADVGVPLENLVIFPEKVIKPTARVGPPGPPPAPPRPPMDDERFDAAGAGPVSGWKSSENTPGTHGLPGYGTGKSL